MIFRRLLDPVAWAVIVLLMIWWGVDLAWMFLVVPAWIAVRVTWLVLRRRPG